MTDATAGIQRDPTAQQIIGEAMADATLFVPLITPETLKVVRQSRMTFAAGWVLGATHEAYPHCFSEMNDAQRKGIETDALTRAREMVGIRIPVLLKSSKANTLFARRGTRVLALSTPALASHGIAALRDEDIRLQLPMIVDLTAADVICLAYLHEHKTPWRQMSEEEERRAKLWNIDDERRTLRTMLEGGIGA